MRLFAIALTLVLTIRGASATPEPRVVGGQPVYPGQFPFLVGLVYPPSNGVLCTGSLIRNTWVLTAAHCITSAPPATVMISDALQGADGPTHQVTEIPVKRIIVHPQWNPTTFVNDIALIELTGDATQFPPLVDGMPEYAVSTIALAATPSSAISGIGSVTIAGFGRTNATPSPSVANWAGPIPTFPTSTCSATFAPPAINPQTQLCYGTYPNVCNGDSGGPVFGGSSGSFSQYGIVSFGKDPCGTKQEVATYVPGFVTWINQQINGSSPGGTCTPSSTRLCLLNNRFSVTLRWNDGSGFRDALVADPKANSAGSGAGLFYFYSEDPSNWEVLVKMIDACGGGNFWLLGSASTGFGWELTVRDEKAGVTKTYTKPLNGQASGIADFSAFQTCGQ